MSGVGVLGVAGGVEDEELRLRPPVALVADPGGRQIGLRLLGDVPGIAAVLAAGQRIADVADQAQRLPAVHRVHRRGARVRDQKHIALVYSLKSPDARPVEAGAFLEQLLRDLARRDADVLQRAGNVRELQVDNLNSLVINQFYDFFWRHPVAPYIYCFSLRLPRCESLSYAEHAWSGYRPGIILSRLFGFDDFDPSGMFTSLAIWLSGGGRRITAQRLLLATLPQLARKHDPQAEQSNECYTTENYFYTHLIGLLEVDVRRGPPSAAFVLCKALSRRHVAGVLRGCKLCVTYHNPMEAPIVE